MDEPRARTEGQAWKGLARSVTGATLAYPHRVDPENARGVTAERSRFDPFVMRRRDYLRGQDHFAGCSWNVRPPGIARGLPISFLLFV